MASTFRRETNADVDSRSRDTRLAELVMALTGCDARRALELVRHEPGAAPLDRVAYALAAIRHNSARRQRSL